MFDIDVVRSGFPSLERMQNGQEVAYLDGPGGTQVHSSVVDAMAGFMQRGGSNHGGYFATSQETDSVVAEARSGVADLLGADPIEIVFGQNMTSLTYSLSRALSRTWSSGDNIIVTRLDHDANVTPWIQAAKDVGVQVRFVDFDPGSGCSLDLGTLDRALDNRTRLVAFTHASNAVGTVTDVEAIVSRAHAVGARTFVDAVHYAPHGSIDVRATDTDFLATSVYKWFGPHTGCLYGKKHLLNEIAPYKLRPSPDNAPDRWETGTQSFESLAGVVAAVEYLASLGEGASRRSRLVSAYDAIAMYEASLSDRFLAGLSEMPHIELFGKPGSADRTPTFALEVAEHEPDAVARTLGDAGCFVWSGEYYAFEVMHRLDRPDNGLVRIGFVHYNTISEVDRVLSLLGTLA
jgi:cysteine desulfurase family protein (TIGR01976 family)